MMRMRFATLDPIVLGARRPGRAERRSRGCIIPHRTRPAARTRSKDRKVCGCRSPARGRTIPGVPALIGLGLTHRTAPLAVRERLALAPAEATELLAAARGDRGRRRGRRALDVQPHRGLRRGRGRRRGRARRGRRARRHAGMSAAALGLRLRAPPRPRGRRPSLRRRLRPRLDGPRRGRDPRPAAPRPRALARGGLVRAAARPPVRDALGAGRRARAGTGIARCGRVGLVRGGGARPRGARLACRPPRDARGRGQEQRGDRARPAQPRRARPAGREPQPRARGGDRAPRRAGGRLDDLEAQLAGLGPRPRRDGVPARPRRRGRGAARDGAPRRAAARRSSTSPSRATSSRRSATSPA